MDQKEFNNLKSPHDLKNQIDELFDELISQQNRKVLATARQLISHLTADDILNPHDFPELMQNPIFNYEEGIAAGLMAAQFAMRARIPHIVRNQNEK